MIFFTNSSAMEFQVRYLASLQVFLDVVLIFVWFWLGSLFKNIQLMLEFLIMLSRILLSMLMILLFTLSVSSWSEYRKIRTRENSVFGHFSRSENFLFSIPSLFLYEGSLSICKTERTNLRNLCLTILQEKHR